MGMLVRPALLGAVCVLAGCARPLPETAAATPPAESASPPAEEADTSDGAAEDPSRPEPPTWVENTTPKGDPPPDAAFPADLLDGNIPDTDYTAIVTVERGKVQWHDDEPPKPTGYVNHIYEAKVLETIRGERHDQIVYSEMAEASFQPRLPGYPLIVSLCRGGAPGEYFVPDNGYVGAATPELIERAKRVAKSVKSSKAAACP